MSLRAAAFIDHSYLSIAANKSGLHYSLSRLIAVVGNGYRIVDRRLYGSTIPADSRDLFTPEELSKIDSRKNYLEKKNKEGYKVVVVDRALRPPEKFNCRECDNSFLVERVPCPKCGKPVVVPRQKAFFEEKEVDVAIAVEMMSLAKDNVFDVALLFSGDRDFRYVVDRFHYIGKTVVNASFKWGHSYALRRRCKEFGGDFVVLDALIGERMAGSPVWRREPKGRK